MTDLREHEATVSKLVEDVLARFQAKMDELGLQPTWIEPRRTGAVDACSVEFEIDFLRDGQIVDVVEFHVIEKGKPTASVDEVQSWLEETFDDVVRRDGG